MNDPEVRIGWLLAIGLLASATPSQAPVRPSRPQSAVVQHGPMAAAASPAVPVRTDCRQCHVVGGHPVGIAVKRPVALPLSATGTIECVTCHEIPASHGGESPAAPSGETAAAPRRVAASLRSPAPVLCASCHATGAGNDRLFHALAMGRGHETAPQQIGDGRLDTFSQRCIACHDGAAARAVEGVGRGFDAGAPSHSAAPMAGGGNYGHDDGHSTGIAYRSAMTRSGLHLQPEAMLPGAVQLFDGRIGCGTCHSVYSTGAQLLNLPLRGSVLCRACHDM